MTVERLGKVLFWMRMFMIPPVITILVLSRMFRWYH
jgi:hypothetical protein